jgi:hypothetical protein
VSTQSQFSAAIFDASLPAPAGLSGPDGAPAGKRFDVYRNNVVFSLMKASEDTFPRLRKLIGPQRFSALAADFVRTHPPTSKMMMQFSDQLPSFLENFEPLRSIGYLADIARVELAMRQSYHAADSTPVANSAFEAVDTDVLMASTLQLSPALRLVQSAWPIHAIWQLSEDPQAHKPVMRAEDILVTRAAFDPQLHLLAPGAAAFVGGLQRGVNFATSIDEASEVNTNFDLTSTLGILLAGGAVTAIIKPEN